MAGVKPNHRASPGPIANTGGLVTPETSPHASGPGNTAPTPQPTKAEQGWWSRWGSSAVHLGLDIIGIIPVVGEVADGANALIYLAEGDKVNAALSAAAMLPTGGQAATAAKWGKKGAQAVAEQAEKKGAKEVVEQSTKKVEYKETKNSAPQESGNPPGGYVDRTANDAKKNQAKQNKKDGIRREHETESELKKNNPDSSVQREQYLRDQDGKIVKDPLTGEARRVDHVVIKDGRVTDAVETTSMTADKAAQVAKENRIMENGGTFVRDRTTGRLAPLGDDGIRIIRRE